MANCCCNGNTVKEILLWWLELVMDWQLTRRLECVHYVVPDTCDQISILYILNEDWICLWKETESPTVQSLEHYNTEQYTVWVTGMGLYTSRTVCVAFEHVYDVMFNQATLVQHGLLQYIHCTGTGRQARVLYASFCYRSDSIYRTCMTSLAIWDIWFELCGFI